MGSSQHTSSEKECTLSFARKQARPETYVNRAFDVVGLVFDVWTKSDANNLDSGLEIIKNLNLTIRSTKDTALGENVPDDRKTLVLVSVIGD